MAITLFQLLLRKLLTPELRWRVLTNIVSNMWRQKKRQVFLLHKVNHLCQVISQHKILLFLFYYFFLSLIFNLLTFDIHTFSLPYPCTINWNKWIFLLAKSVWHIVWIEKAKLVSQYFIFYFQISLQRGCRLHQNDLTVQKCYSLIKTSCTMCLQQRKLYCQVNKVNASIFWGTFGGWTPLLGMCFLD